MNVTPTGINSDTATFAAGCFWCVEAIFQELKGVQSVTSGYTGGTVKNPSYREVCTGATGHAEACMIIYDPSVITYDALLEAFGEPKLHLNILGYRPLKTSLAVYGVLDQSSKCVDAFTMVKLEDTGEWVVADYFCR